MAKLSRAKWVGSYYLRKGTRTWRNANNGEITSKPYKKGNKYELRGFNFYNKDSRTIPKAIKRTFDIEPGDARKGVTARRYAQKLREER